MQTVWIDEIPATPVGPLWVAVTEAGLAAVEIGASREVFVQALGRRGLTPAVLDPGHAAEAIQEIDAYLAGERREFDLKLDWSGMGDFQQAVLRRVAAIPYGQVTTYGEIARQMGRPRAARAVGRANATNPLPLVIPCHRVIGSDGGLHGYGAPGGIQTKKWLLEMEGYLR